MSIQTIGILNSGRLARIAQAPSLDQASKMGLLDRIIDWFRGGVKRSTIESLYDSITTLKSADASADIQTRLDDFLKLRSLALPAHKQEFEFDLVENPNGSCTCSLSLAGQRILEVDDIVNHRDIEYLRQKKERLNVEDFLLSLQDVRDPKLKLLHSDRKFSIQQGEIGDCYALASMIGALSRVDAKEKIENMASITSDGQFRLTFKADLDEALTHMRGRTLRQILSSKHDAAVMQTKGYTVDIQGDELQVSISSAKLKGIMGDTRSAQTNCLIVNIMEHFVGNLLEQPDGGLRSRRDSLTSHDTRTGNYDKLVANLLGYRNAYQSVKPYNEKRGVEPLLAELEQTFRNFDESGVCLTSKRPAGFVYVGMEYGQPDAQGKIHARHALVLNRVIYDNPQLLPDTSVNRKVVALELVNPWNSNNTERIPLAEAAKRTLSLAVYRPRPEPLSIAAWTPDPAEVHMANRA